MAIELRQQLKLSQQLIMTPQLQMAIKLLQLSRLELMETIRQELEEAKADKESAQRAAQQLAEFMDRVPQIAREFSPESMLDMAAANTALINNPETPGGRFRTI